MWSWYFCGSLPPHFITSRQCQEFGSGSGSGPHSGPLQQWAAFLRKQELGWAEHNQVFFTWALLEIPQSLMTGPLPLPRLSNPGGARKPLTSYDTVFKAVCILPEGLKSWSHLTSREWGKGHGTFCF